jgi:hypothetical protein
MNSTTRNLIERLRGASTNLIESVWRWWTAGQPSTWPAGHSSRSPPTFGNWILYLRIVDAKSHCEPTQSVFEVEVFFSYQNIDFPFIWRDSWSVLSFFFFFSILFLPLFLFFFYDLSLEDLGVLMILEEKITSLKTSFQMKWYGLVKCGYRRWTHILEWSYARQYG